MTITRVFPTIGAFLYLNKKNDEISDSTPVIGYLDDLIILSNAMEVAKDDLDHYRSDLD